MFTVARRPGESQEQERIADRLTQMGRALRELGIGWIAAYSPQAKGRVERSFQTDQDRLIKELRLAKVKTMPAANEFLEKEYWPEWNAKFARPAKGEEDLHRPMAEGFELGSALSHVEHRIITNNYTFPYYSQQYQIAREDVQPATFRGHLWVHLRYGPVLGSRTGAVPRRLLLGLYPRFPSSCPFRSCRRPVSSPRRVAPSVQISRTRRTCLLLVKLYET